MTDMEYINAERELYALKQELRDAEASLQYGEEEMAYLGNYVSELRKEIRSLKDFLNDK